MPDHGGSGVTASSCGAAKDWEVINTSANPALKNNLPIERSTFRCNSA